MCCYARFSESCIDLIKESGCVMIYPRSAMFGVLSIAYQFEYVNKSESNAPWCISYRIVRFLIWLRRKQRTVSIAVESAFVDVCSTAVLIASHSLVAKGACTRVVRGLRQCNSRTRPST